MRECNVLVKRLKVPAADLLRKWRRCGQCADRWFYRSDNLRQHILYCHTPNPSDWPFLCAVCDLPKRAKAEVIAHMKRDHPEEDITEMGVKTKKAKEAHFGLFDRKMALMDRIMAISVENWYWRLPSNRFANSPDQLHSNRLENHRILVEFQSGRSSAVNCVDQLIELCIPEELLHAIQDGPEVARYI